VWAAMYAVYLVFILISAYTFLAEESVDNIRSNMDASYTYHLTFEYDGVKTHYDVERNSASSPGKIDLTYYTQDNKLDVYNVDNIRTLKIDVQSLFNDESQKVFKKSNVQIPTMDMDYWLEAGDGIFTVEFNIDKDKPMDTLTFTKFPTPTSVLVNNQEWWTTSLNYEISDNDLIISDIPTGETVVVIYFKSQNQVPNPDFTTTPAQFADVNENVTFDGSFSADPDGSIISWVWTFGDGNDDSGEKVYHVYTAPGTYTIRLTVRDNSVPFAEAFAEKNITVAFGALDDFDSDGLRDIWEWDNFGTLTTDPNSDPDGDEATNIEEFEAGTDPNDELDFPAKDVGVVKEEPKSNSMLFAIIAIVVIIVILIPVLLSVMKSKKAKAEDMEAIIEMEAKIEKAKKLGLPTRDLERLLKQAREGKGIKKDDSDNKGRSKNSRDFEE
jgi:PKD repeat protein